MTDVSGSSARAVALRVVRRVFEEGAYADRALHAEARRAGLVGRELAFATRLAYGTVQRRRTLDVWAQELAERPVARLEPVVRAAVELGLLQVGFLDGVAPHAAVHETVELVKRDAPRGAGLVNAVLRRALRDGRPARPDATPGEAAIAHSVPDWLAVMWWEELGPEEARALLRTVNDPPEQAVRVNPLRPADLARIPGQRADPGLPEALVLDGPWDAWGSPEWRSGAVFPQSRASMHVAHALDPRPGERVLDLCAAPGGKTTHLAALMQDRGEVVAVERNPGRARGLRETAQRAGATCVRVVVADARELDETGFDRVLVDPPCSGLGTLRSRPDLRWRADPAHIADLAALQEEILRTGERALRPGGTLVYSVCTLSRREEPDRPWTFTRRILPHRDHTEGFFVGRLA